VMSSLSSKKLRSRSSFVMRRKRLTSSASSEDVRLLILRQVCWPNRLSEEKSRSCSGTQIMLWEGGVFLVFSNIQKITAAPCRAEVTSQLRVAIKSWH
jgi:hypothetical protein